MDEPLFEMYRGDDHAIRFTIKDGDGVPVNIAGWVFKCSMSLNPYGNLTDPVDVFVRSEVMAGEWADQGIVKLLLPREQTQHLLPVPYFFDIRREAHGTVKTVVSGRVQVLVDVTRGNT